MIELPVGITVFAICMAGCALSSFHLGRREGIESTYEWYKKNIGYEEVIQRISPLRRFLNWMDQ